MTQGLPEPLTPFVEGLPAAFLVPAQPLPSQPNEGPPVEHGFLQESSADALIWANTSTKANPAVKVLRFIDLKFSSIFIWMVFLYLFWLKGYF